jgi:hypothetical protein
MAHQAWEDRRGMTELTLSVRQLSHINAPLGNL